MIKRANIMVEKFMVVDFPLKLCHSALNEFSLWKCRSTSYPSSEYVLYVLSGLSVSVLKIRWS